MSGRPLAAVTGGTGFLGRRLVARLLAEGWRVRALVRRPGALPAGAEATPGSLEDRGSLDALVAGADAVVHLAGLVRARDADAFAACNRDGAARVGAAAAGTAPGARLVVVSSMAARSPHLSPYAASKRAGEAAALEAHGGAGPAAVVRPCAVYGPGDPATAALLRLARAGVFPSPRPPEPRIALVHVDDAAGALAALCRGGADGRTVEVADARTDGYGLPEIAAAAEAAVGRRIRVVPLPDAAFRLAAWIAEGAGRTLRRPALFSSGKAAELLHRDWAGDPDGRIDPAIWRPRITLGEGLRSVAEGERSRPSGLARENARHVLPTSDRSIGRTSGRFRLH
jgi:nucleoside-diphosphate-sugar epimerase